MKNKATSSGYEAPVYIANAWNSMIGFLLCKMKQQRARTKIL